MSDNYQFLKSNVSQSQSKYTPYTDKQYNYVNDINNGVYTNTSMSLLQFDLSSIFNSSRMTDTSDHYLVIPTCTVAAYTSGVATLVAPGTSSSGPLQSMPWSQQQQAQAQAQEQLEAKEQEHVQHDSLQHEHVQQEPL